MRGNGILCGDRSEWPWSMWLDNTWLSFTIEQKLSSISSICSCLSLAAYISLANIFIHDNVFICTCRCPISVSFTGDVLSCQPCHWETFSRTLSYSMKPLYAWVLNFLKPVKVLFFKKNFPACQITWICNKN